MEKRTNLWTVMLSGGDGERLRPFVQRLFGRDRAKQYCTFIGNRTMFEQTADRARMLAPAQHSVAVVAKSHVERGWVGREQMPEGKLLAQPCNHDTGPGVLLPLAYVRRKDPDASVVILPCDHFVYPEYLFTQRVINTIEAVEAFPERVVLLGACPEKPMRILVGLSLPVHSPRRLTRRSTRSLGLSRNLRPKKPREL